MKTNNPTRRQFITTAAATCIVPAGYVALGAAPRSPRPTPPTNSEAAEYLRTAMQAAVVAKSGFAEADRQDDVEHPEFEDARAILVVCERALASIGASADGSLPPAVQAVANHRHRNPHNIIGSEKAFLALKLMQKNLQDGFSALPDDSDDAAEAVTSAYWSIGTAVSILGCMLCPIEKSPPPPKYTWDNLAGAVHGLLIAAEALAEMHAAAPEWDEWGLDKPELAIMQDVVAIRLGELRQIRGVVILGPAGDDVEKIRNYSQPQHPRDLPGQAKALLSLQLAEHYLREALDEERVEEEHVVRKMLTTATWCAESIRASIDGVTNSIVPDWGELE